jgi:hypothetical protein
MEDYGTSLTAIMGNGITLRAFKSHEGPWNTIQGYETPKGTKEHN